MLSSSKFHNSHFNHLLHSLAWSVPWHIVTPWQNTGTALQSPCQCHSKDHWWGAAVSREHLATLNPENQLVCVDPHTTFHVLPLPPCLLKWILSVQQHVASHTVFFPFPSNMRSASDLTSLVVSVDSYLSWLHCLDLYHPWSIKTKKKGQLREAWLIAT